MLIIGKEEHLLHIITVQVLQRVILYVPLLIIKEYKTVNSKHLLIDWIHKWGKEYQIIIMLY